MGNKISNIFKYPNNAEELKFKFDKPIKAKVVDVYDGDTFTCIVKAKDVIPSINKERGFIN